MTHSAAFETKERLRADLLIARKARDVQNVDLLRNLIGAIDNSEAPDNVVCSSSNVTLVDNVATSEQPRKVLSSEDVHQVILNEINELEQAASDYEAHRELARAESLRTQAAQARQYLNQ